jgi:hypothetical protein
MNYNSFGTIGCISRLADSCIGQMPWSPKVLYEVNVLFHWSARHYRFTKGRNGPKWNAAIECTIIFGLSERNPIENRSTHITRNVITIMTRWWWWLCYWRCRGRRAPIMKNPFVKCTLYYMLISITPCLEHCRTLTRFHISEIYTPVLYIHIYYVYQSHA